jgi:hypothetical protein
MGAVQRVLHGMSYEDTRLSKRQTRPFLFVFILSCLVFCCVVLSCFFFLFSCDVLLPSLSCLLFHVGLCCVESCYPTAGTGIPFLRPGLGLGLGLRLGLGLGAECML